MPDKLSLKISFKFPWWGNLFLKTIVIPCWLGLVKVERVTKFLVDRSTHVLEE